MIKKTLFILLIFSWSSLTAQNNLHEIHAGFGAASGTKEKLPFWLVSNRYSLLERDYFNVYSAIGYHKKFSKDKNFDIAYGAKLINRFSNDYHIYPEELYGRIKYRLFIFQAGRLCKGFNNEDNKLSSGNLLWSGNAIPLPEISIFTSDYFKLPLLNNMFSIKGGLQHGWFDNNQFIKKTRLHHKFLYLKIGGEYPVNLAFGIHHYAQWAGISSDTLIGKLPDNLKKYMKIVFAAPGGKQSPKLEQLNAAGNHLGNYDLKINVDLKSVKMDYYWQSIFEDKSGLRLNNLMDGLYGASLIFKKKSIIDHILIEILSTTNQSGKPPDFSDPSDTRPPIWNDNYFNHWLYRMGWSYKNMGIGNPLITSPAISEFKNSREYFNNNRVRALHTGVSGKTNLLNYTILCSLSNNYGTFNSPFKPIKKQTSILLNIKFPELFLNTDLNIAFGIDRGKLYGNNEGFHISFFKKWTI